MLLRLWGALSQTLGTPVLILRRYVSKKPQSKRVEQGRTKSERRGLLEGTRKNVFVVVIAKLGEPEELCGDGSFCIMLVIQSDAARGQVGEESEWVGTNLLAVINGLLVSLKGDHPTGLI